MTYARAHAYTVAHTPRCTSPEKCTYGNAERYRDHRRSEEAARCPQKAPHWSTPRSAHTCTPRTGIRTTYSETRDLCADTQTPSPTHRRTLRQAPAGGLQGNSLASRGLGWRQGYPRALYFCEWESTKISFVIPFLRARGWSWGGLELPLRVGAVS